MTVKVTGERRYSFDLPQWGMEIPAEFYLQIGKEGTYLPNEREDIGGDKKIWREKKKRDGK